ncbi:NUP88 (predicted), partial [Pycnogonum litorale]
VRTNMADSDWREQLIESSIFSSLKDKNKSKAGSNESKNMLTVKDDVLFVWDDFNSCVLTTIVYNSAKTSETAPKRHQVLSCSNPPISRITNLLLNTHGNLLALVGPRGITVLEVPQRWGKNAEFQGGKDTVICRSRTIAERFFVCNNRIKVLQVRWFPVVDGQQDNYLVTLCSDNYLRIYRVDDPQSPVQVYCLSEHSSLSLTRTSSVAVSLGETAVSFDFGPSVGEEKKSRGEDIVYPLFILRGNGDVYSMMLQPPGLKKIKRTTMMQGPLTMHPAADDNYGVDAFSILCLQCSPPVLVIATSSGTLYHCVVLEKSVAELETLDDSSISRTDTRIESREYGLYVYESVELEFQMSTSAYDDDIMCPIMLHHDPRSCIRYHCSHSAGVHTVALPVIQHLEQYIEKDDISSLPNLQDQECIVEHLICTKPLPSSPESPVLGVDIMVHNVHGSNLICLTSQFTLLCLPLSQSYTTPAFNLLSEMPGDVVSSPVKLVYQESFEKHISSILRRKVSNPMIKSNPSVELTPQEGIQLLSRITQIFREEYIDKLDLAREEIERRMRILVQQKNQQLSTLDQCLTAEKVLSDRSDRLLDKFNRIHETQTNLMG